MVTQEVCLMVRQMWSWLSARRLFRLPAWAGVVAVVFALGAVVGPVAASAGSANGSSVSDPPPGVPPLKHVFVIMMENTSYDDLLSSSNQNTTFIQQLTANNGLATNYFGVTHVSLPNYIAATSGQT
jgi:phosphatidylinositol-3-phosphatase